MCEILTKYKDISQSYRSCKIVPRINVVLFKEKMNTFWLLNYQIVYISLNKSCLPYKYLCIYQISTNLVKKPKSYGPLFFIAAFTGALILEKKIKIASLSCEMMHISSNTKYNAYVKAYWFFFGQKINIFYFIFIMRYVTV